jgi:CDGSH-type Zn-finger protein/uncharacterized Fe-S cluster protein YjdI
MTDFTAHAPSREQLLYWLHEAAEIEHNLMCCYLYAAFSLKRDSAGWRPEERDAVARWRRVITAVALEEMSHLALVGNLVNALGASPPLTRPAFPVEGGPYPAGFVIRLAPFCAATIEHFTFLERPQHETAVADGAGFAPSRTYRRAVPASRLSPGPRDYTTVGELYEVIAASLHAAAAEHGEAALFVGDPALQLDATLAPLPGVAPVTDLRSALAAVTTIVTQGEGAGSESADSHFCRFSRIADELAALTAANPGFEPAWPAASNPVMNAPVHSAAERVHVNHPQNAHWLDIGNAMYTTSLRCLLQGFVATDRRAKQAWLNASFEMMRALLPVGMGLAARPAQGDAALPHGGLTFTPLRTLAALPEGRAERVVAERLAQLRERALALPLVLVSGETPESWQAVIDMLARQRAALLALAGVQEAPAAAAAPTVPAGAVAPTAGAAAPAPVAHEPAAGPAAATPPPAPVEVARGAAVTLFFEGRRCIHSRHCVLEAPGVFKANTPGEWIYPDTMSAEALVEVAHKCPSGAIRWQRHDGGAEETAPPVNTLHVRENGPYALRAPLRIAGHPDAPAFRATLCRCGQSRSKPFCDGSHVAAAFSASGEPPTSAVDPLPVRDGPLDVTPLKDGPLRVEGNLEMCAGTGRTVARVTQAALCRCGHSRNKPFCDRSHVAAGFTAGGAA